MKYEKFKLLDILLYGIASFTFSIVSYMIFSIIICHPFCVTFKLALSVVYPLVHKLSEI